MKDNHYLTIDPLILETLNLNQHRMNHILDILHGRQPRKQMSYATIRTERLNNRSSRKINQSSLRVENQEDNLQKKLPPILLSHRHRGKNIDEKTQMRLKTKRLQKNKSLGSIESSSVYSEQRSDNKTSTIKISKKQPIKKKQLDKTIQQIVEQYDDSELKHQRRNQVMKDYMSKQAKKTKQINPKDLYRIEIQSMISELTQIEDLDNAEKKMKRFKKRHKHLVNFDKNYFLKLNQHDLMVLS